MHEKGSPDGGQSLEELIEQSLRQTVSFDTAQVALRQRGKEKPTLQQRLMEKMPAAAAVANAALSIPGNPAYTPVAVGALTYILADKAARIAANDKRIEHQGLGTETAAGIYNRLFQFKPVFSAISFATALAGSVSYDLYKRQVDLSSDFSGFYSGLFQQLPNLTPEIAFSVVNGLGAYVLLSGLERLLHSESLATAAHIVAVKFDKITGKPGKAISHLERLANVPHSKEKEKAVLLRLGDAYMKAGQSAEAMNAYKRMLRAAARQDDSRGISDWLIRRKVRRSYRGSSAEEGIYTRVQKAMHEFAGGNLAAANSLLAQAAAAEPRNRQLRRIRALFFEATGNEAAANLEMHIYSGLLRQDPSLAFAAVGESRNEVLVDPDGELYIKRSRNKASLDEEVENIIAFSRELPGMLPRVVRQGFDGQYHYIELESMGSATMLQKAINGTLSRSDVKAVLDLLVKVIVAGEKLRKEGKIKVAEPAAAATYSYSIANVPSVAEQFRKEGVNPEQPNTAQGFSVYFMHRIFDLFISRVQASNGVDFSEKFANSVLEGTAGLGFVLLQDPSTWAVYTDWTQRNPIFGGLHGNLCGKVDWEQVRILPVFFELVNILEFYGPHIGPVAHKELTEYFIGRLEKGTHQRVNRKILKMRYEAAAVLRHLELVGYRSRDTATNPENLRAQIYHHLMARMHLVEAIRHTPSLFPKPLAREARQTLEEMLTDLENESILKEKGQQQQLESEIRPLLIPGIAYLRHEITQKSYWQEFLLSFSPKRTINEILHPKPSPYKDSGLAVPATVLLGFPSALAAIAAYMSLSYAAMQKIMPSL
ncbi:hypothetical protein HYU16_02875 [Candidatus Woesearchaeota archaeon]|nr:hypothetical protein [Candidatus Woesearchaeota archaeon]